MSVLLWVSHIFLIAAVTSFLSCILNVRTYPRLSSFSLSLENCPMRSRTKTSELSSGRNRTRSTLSYSRVLSISVSILRTSTSYFSQDSFTFRSFYPRNHTFSSTSISNLRSLSSTSERSALSAFSLQLWPSPPQTPAPRVPSLVLRYFWSRPFPPSRRISPFAGGKVDPNCASFSSSSSAS